MSAIISDCGKYRYFLQRETGMPDERTLLFIMLNPSTADASLDDPTIRKCKGFGGFFGYGKIAVVNLFAFRATNPAELSKTNFPEGPENLAHIAKAINSADKIICAWGTKGVLFGQDRRVLKYLSEIKKELYALEITKDGHPKHPLYISYDKQPILFREAT